MWSLGSLRERSGYARRMFTAMSVLHTSLRQKQLTQGRRAGKSGKWVSKQLAGTRLRIGCGENMKGIILKAWARLC